MRVVVTPTRSLKVSDQDGGPAYPLAQVARGMSLRDWFAGMALANLDLGDETHAADRAYRIAAAMIEERNRLLDVEADQFDQV